MNILISGGHSGMGLELTKKLLSEGHQIGLIVRSDKRKKDAIEALASLGKVDFFIADLSKRDQILRVAEEISNRWPHIDVIFNNAGVLLDKLNFSDYGNELQLEINAISPYLLTTALLPLLGKAETPLVVNTATAGLNSKKSINIEAFKRPPKFTKLTGSYMDSKFALVLLMNYLNKTTEGIRFVSLNPGAIKTKMTAGDGMPFWLKPIRNLLFKSPGQGAENIYNAAFGKNTPGSGIYLSNGKPKEIKVSLTQDQVEELVQ